VEPHAGLADRKSVTWWLALFLLKNSPAQRSLARRRRLGFLLVWSASLALCGLLQQAQPQADRVRAAMEGSLEKQRASVRLQAKSAGASATPWTFDAAPTAVVSPQAFCEAIGQPELIRMIDSVASRQGIDPSVVREVARQESGFRPCAVSVKGAEGLMQLMPPTQAQFRVQDPFDALENLEAGTSLLKQLLERYHGDLSLALSAYNAGPYRVDQAGGIPEIPETKNYVSTILDRLAQ